MASVRLHPSEAKVAIRSADLGEVDDISRDDSARHESSRAASATMPPPAPRRPSAVGSAERDAHANGHHREHRKEKKRHKKVGN